MAKVPTRFREYKLRYGYTHDELAEKLSLSKAQILRMVNNENYTIKKMLDVCELFQITPNDLFNVAKAEDPINPHVMPTDYSKLV